MPGQCIRIFVLLPRTMFHREIELLQDFEPPALLPDWLWRSSEPLQNCVICPDSELSSKKVLSELFQEEHDS